MSDGPNNFDDPSLKQAIRQLRGGHRAAPQLREKVASLLKGEVAGTIKPRGRFFKPFIAIAAALVIAIVGYNFYIQRQLEQPIPHSEKLLIAMVAAHTNKSGDPGCHRLDAPLTDPAALVAEASNKLGIKIPALALGDWKVDGASLCKFDDAEGLKIQLTRGNQTVTLVSVSKDAAGSYGADHYEKKVEGSPIAGVIINDTLTCFVADPNVDLKQVARIRDQILAR